MRRLTLIAFLAMVGCGDGCIELERRDYGMLANDQGVDLCPQELPWEVVCDSSCDEAEGDWFEPGIAWWNERIPGSFVSLGQDDEEFEDRWLNNWPGTVFVSVETLPAEIDWEGVVVEDEGGICRLQWNGAGQIVSAWIRINHAYAYDEDFVRSTWLHELGHTFGFADDMGPPQTVDLASIMGSPTPSDGDLLASDLELYEETCVLDP
jgi:hypothetical protein